MRRCCHTRPGRLRRIWYGPRREAYVAGFSSGQELPICHCMQYVPVDVELRRISPAKLKLALAAMLLLVALDIAELMPSLG